MISYSIVNQCLGSGDICGIGTQMGVRISMMQEKAVAELHPLAFSGSSVRGKDEYKSKST